MAVHGGRRSCTGLVDGPLSPVSQETALVSRRAVSFWAPPLFCMFLMFLVSSQSRISIPDQLSDKWLHFLAYLILAVLLLRAFHQGPGRPLRWRATVLAVGCASAYGVLDEIHQTFVPGRFGSSVDLLADVAGALAAVGLLFTWNRFVRVRSPLNDC